MGSLKVQMLFRFVRAIVRWENSVNQIYERIKSAQSGMEQGEREKEKKKLNKKNKICRMFGCALWL